MKSKLTDFLTRDPQKRNTTHRFPIGATVTVSFQEWQQPAKVLSHGFNVNNTPTYWLQGSFPDAFHIAYITDSTERVEFHERYVTEYVASEWEDQE